MNKEYEQMDLFEEEQEEPKKSHVPKSWSDKPKRKTPVHEIDHTDPYLDAEDIFNE